MADQKNLDTEAKRVLADVPDRRDRGWRGLAADNSEKVAFAGVAGAAVLLVAVGLNLYRPSTESTPIDGAALHVKLGESPGSMSDDRFVELAVELLRADRRYLDEMADLLDDVHNDAFVPETASHARHEERETRFARTETSDRKPSVQSVSSVPAAF